MLIIDRFEGKFAVIETDDRTTFNLPRVLLPPEAREGDVIILNAKIDKKATSERRKKSQDLMYDFFNE